MNNKSYLTNFFRRYHDFFENGRLKGCTMVIYKKPWFRLMCFHQLGDGSKYGSWFSKKLHTFGLIINSIIEPAIIDYEASVEYERKSKEEKALL